MTEMRVHVAMLLLLASLVAEATDEGYRCPRTIGPRQEIAGFPGDAWYGSAALAAWLPEDGYWTGQGAERDYLGKLFWWTTGYNASLDSTPALKVKAYRLDAKSRPAGVGSATNVVGSTRGMDGMLILITFPSEGCWRVVGTYEGHSLSFVMEVRGAYAELNNLLTNGGFWDVKPSRSLLSQP